MRKTRQAMMVAVLATAMCADRVVAAAPLIGPQVGAMARQLVGRLSGSLGRVVTTARVDVARAHELAVDVASPIRAVVFPVVIHSSQSSPFRFRLPPPNA